MIKRITLALGLAICAFTAAEAQVQNYALQLDASSSVDCGPMPQLKDLDTYSVQFWLNPTVWTEGAVLFSRGSDFKAVLGAEGTVEFTLGEGKLVATSEALAAGEWAQVTVLVTNGAGSVRVNDKRAGSAANISLGGSQSLEPFVIGGAGYRGRIDELRLWKCLLSGDFDYYTFNTLNQWMPQYEDLMVYYKMDQELCENLVDYTDIDKDPAFNNHGILKDGATKVAVTDNEKLPYILNSAYTANERFFDRVIPADQYRLSNDIIILGVQSYEDGHLELGNANNHATLTGDAKYLDEFDGRTGVLSLSGDGALEAPLMTMKSANNYSFESWVYLDEWTDGAYLFRKENADGTKGLAIMLDTFTVPNTGAVEKVLVVRVNGNCWRYPNTLSVGEWQHLGVLLKAGTTVSTCFTLTVNGSTVANPRVYFHDGGTDFVPEWPEEGSVLFGQGLKGKLDNVATWRMSFGNTDMTSHMRALPMVTLNTQVTSSTLQNADTYYSFDDPANPGFDYYSQDNWLRIMKSAYDGYRGYRFYISVKQPAGTQNIDQFLGKPSWRQKFATDLAEISKSYDGVELDLEWTYSWVSYGLLAQAIREALPEGKIFRVSTHNVTFGFPLDKMEYVDGFTFQQYGPQKDHFIYSTFENYCKKFVNYGYDPKKIMTSYSTTTSRGFDKSGTAVSPIRGVKDNFFSEDYVPGGESESKTFGTETFWFTGPLQTYKRAKYTRENGFMGIFYWDMGNDTWDTAADGSHVMSKWNLARWSSYAINSNVDRLVTEVEIKRAGAGVEGPVAESSDLTLSVAISGPTAYFCVPGRELGSVNIYTLSGSLAYSESLTDGTANLGSLAPGLYTVAATGADGRTYAAKFCKK